MESTPPLPTAPLPAKAAAAGSTDKHGNAASSSHPSCSLHAVRKPQAKPWKKPTATPPAPPKVYRVDPRDFRLLVQRLTGALELAPRRLLRDTAPAQLDVVSRLSAPKPPPLQLLAAPVPVYGHRGLSSSSTLEGSRGFPLGEVPWGETPQTMADAGHPAQNNTASVSSPSLHSEYLTWCNLPLLSPGSMQCLEQSTVL